MESSIKAAALHEPEARPTSTNNSLDIEGKAEALTALLTHDDHSHQLHIICFAYAC